MSDRDKAAVPAELPGELPVKRRRPLERALVWTLIAGLFVLASVETWSRYSFQRAYDFLGNRLEFGNEQGADALDAGEVKSFLNNREPSRIEDFVTAGKLMTNGATHLEVYSWYTLNPVHRREMFVYYDAHGPAHKDHPQVLAIQASEDEYIPLNLSIERQRPNRNATDSSGRNGDMSPRVPQLPGRGPRGGRPRGANRAVELPAADEAGQDRKPQADTSAI